VTPGSVRLLALWTALGACAWAQQPAPPEASQTLAVKGNALNSVRSQKKPQVRSARSGRVRGFFGMIHGRRTPFATPGSVGLLASWMLQAVSARAQPPAAPEPPEEDQTLAVKEYAFNPVQAQKELQIGNYYFKTGSYSAAKMRFLEATKWNPNYAEAYLRLGETYEKLKDRPAWQKAYEKYLELEPKAKDAAAIRAKLATKPEPSRNPK
jgi:tetratricopeptide (TPR) repeat protein